MPQPDSGDNCCDCPSRIGPCDDCGGVTGGACCANDGSGCFPEPDEATCDALPGRWLGDGTTCDNVVCASCGDCHCAFFGPVINVVGICYESYSIDCEGMLALGSSVDCSAIYAAQSGTSTCCSPCDGSLTCDFNSFCNYIDPMFPVCDTYFSPGCESVLTCETTDDPPVPCNSSSTGASLGQVFDACP